MLNPREHDPLCAWISHVPQMLASALAATFGRGDGERAPLLEAGGRVLREMTRISARPYSMWRDIALTNKKPPLPTPSPTGNRSLPISVTIWTAELSEKSSSGLISYLPQTRRPAAELRPESPAAGIVYDAKICRL